MARAGDGLSRSNTRRTTAMISLRVTEGERHAVQRRADAQGYASVSEFVRDHILHDGNMPLADARMVGDLARIGGWLNDAADALEDAGWAREDAEAFRQHSRVVNAMQIEFIQNGHVLSEEDDLFEGDDDLMEDDDAG